MDGTGMIDAAGLKAIRHAMGATQTDMADALGLTRETYGGMERGKVAIDRRTDMAMRHVEGLYRSVADPTVPHHARRNGIKRLLDLLHRRYG